MSDLSSTFAAGCKVVISPDKMRAWISLVKPARGVQYTLEAVKEWLPQNKVVFGADDAMIRKALASGVYEDMLEVARGKQPVAPSGGDYKLLVENKPFTGLRAAGDGALMYDDLSFLQEVKAGQVLAEIIPAVEAENGMTVTGDEVPPRGGTPGRQLTGSGFEMAEGGRKAVAPGLSHVSIVNNQLIVTPLHKRGGLSAEDGELVFDGNVLLTGDVLENARINATGSVYVVGRTVSAQIKAGNNVLLSGGMRSQGSFGSIEAKGHVWGLFFESANINAGGDICAGHLVGCEVHVAGRANILGGRAMVAGTNLYAQNGVVAGKLGDGRSETVVSVGLEKDFLDRYNNITTRLDRLTIDIQSVQQNITAHERVNSRRPDKGKSDEAYKEMVSKRDQALGVLNILNTERGRMKRTLDQASSVSVIVRETTAPGTLIIIDTRSLKVMTPLSRTKFRRSNEIVEAVTTKDR